MGSLFYLTEKFSARHPSRMSPRSLVSLGAFLEVNPKKLRCRTIFFNGFSIIGKFDPLTAHLRHLVFSGCLFF